jgi:hypothetical protein
MRRAKQTLSESRALESLKKIREEFRLDISESYEIRAKSCASCSTRGACCVDAHFVNVRISRLEAVAIRRVIEKLLPGPRKSLDDRIEDAIERFGLEDSEDSTYACPLFDRDIGCIVHDAAKPLPCISHACYENKEDLPPDELLESAELVVERLNRKVYGRSLPLLPLPVAIRNGLPEKPAQ